MNICIVSWDSEARYLYKILKDRYEVRYVIERDHRLWGKNANGFDIVSFGKAYRLFHENKIDYFLIPCMRGINIKNGIYDRLIRNKIPKDRILYAPLRVFKDDQLTDKEKRELICKFEDRTEIDYLALHIADHCNLNCAGCSVFSALAEHPSLPGFEETKEAVKLLKEKFDQVVVFRILGGEPTLNHKWLEICQWIRRLYPLADVEVVTNGTTILSMTEKVLKKVQKERITFDITYYPVLQEKIDDINTCLNKYHVKHYITQEMETFSRLYNFDASQNPRDNYDVCKMKFMCMNMREYELGVCHAVFGMERAKGRFSEIEYSDDCKIDIRTKDITAKEIIRKLDRPHDICAYCNQDLMRWHMLREENKLNRQEWSI